MAECGHIKVAVEVSKLIPMELLEVSDIVASTDTLTKAVKVDIVTLNKLTDFACKAHLKSNDTFKQMDELVPLINSVIKQLRLAIYSDSCRSNDNPKDNDYPRFYTLDYKRGL